MGWGRRPTRTRSHRSPFRVCITPFDFMVSPSPDFPGFVSRGGTMKTHKSHIYIRVVADINARSPWISTHHTPGTRVLFHFRTPGRWRGRRSFGSHTLGTPCNKGLLGRSLCFSPFSSCIARSPCFFPVSGGASFGAGLAGLVSPSFHVLSPAPGAPEGDEDPMVPGEAPVHEEDALAENAGGGRYHAGITSSAKSVPVGYSDTCDVVRSSPSNVYRQKHLSGLCLYTTGMIRRGFFLERLLYS